MNEHISYWDLLTEGTRLFAFSPNSQKLLYLDDRSGYQTLYQVDLSQLATTRITGSQITSKQYSIVDMQWETNSKIAFAANRSNPMQWSLYEFNLNTYALNKVTDWFSYDESVEKIGFDIIFQTADANSRLTKTYNYATKTLSRFIIPGVDDSKVGSTNTIVEENGLYGVYMKPNAVADTASTLLVWLHGGPDRQDSIEYNSYMSYGGYDWVLNQLQRAGVLALKLLVSYPNQIRGAYSLSGVTDWESLLTNVPSSIFSIDFNGTPNSTNQALYDAASIINNLNNSSNQKLILIQGNADTEVPYQQSQLLDQALLTARKTVDYTTLQGENHIYEDPSSFTLVCNKAMEFVGLTDSPLCTFTN